MTVYTKSQLAAKALREAGIYAPDEALDPNDQDDAEVRAESIVSTLASEGISIVNGSVEEVPDDWYIPLAQYIGMYLLPSYGGPFPTKDQIEGAQRVMRRMTSKPATGSVAEASYY